MLLVRLDFYILQLQPLYSILFHYDYEVPYLRLCWMTGIVRFTIHFTTSLLIL